MDAMKRVGLNTRWYRYQKGLTQEKFSEITNFKMAYISVIESGNANLTCRNIDVIAKSLGIYPEHLGLTFLKLYEKFINDRLIEKHKPKNTK